MEQKFVLPSDCFVWRKGEDILVYNAATKAHVEAKVTDARIGEFCDHMDDLSKLNTDILDEADQANAPFTAFIDSLVAAGCGRVCPGDAWVFSLPARPFVNHNVERMQQEGASAAETLRLLETETIYLGGKHRENEWYRQQAYPFPSKVCPSADEVLDFISRSDSGNALGVIFVVADGNDKRLPVLSEARKGRPARFVFSPESWWGNVQYLHKIAEDGHELALSMSPGDIARFRDGGASLAGEVRPELVTFMIDGPTTLESAETILPAIGAKRQNFVPVWNDNKEFFEEQVLLSKEEILSSCESKRNIFIHQLINVNYWGTLTLFPDGSVYSDVNRAPLGKIWEDVHALIQKELFSQNAWRRVREEGRCAGCVFQWLCPPPGAAEALSGLSACSGR